jgi:hypothetical protein
MSNLTGIMVLDDPTRQIAAEVFNAKQNHVNRQIKPAVFFRF